MEPQTNLDTHGSLQTNALAELIVEISQNKFNGSLRLSKEQAKIVVYFDAGDVVFAASNARQHRIFEMLLQADKITKDQLATIPNFTNDLELKEYALKNNLFDPVEIKNLFSEQILLILKTAMYWETGEWQFSPLLRIKDTLRFPVDLRNLLFEYGRSLPLSELAEKFPDREEFFVAKSVLPGGIVLSTRESFVFSRFENNELTIEKLQNLSGFSENETQRVIYTLWLGGLLERDDWSAAFSERKKAAILSARLSLKKGAQALAVNDENVATVASTTIAEEILDESKTNGSADEQKIADSVISLEEFIAQVENARNFYEVLGLAQTAPISEIKQKYFGFAKRFHPDLYHRETDQKLLQQIQSAFAKLAQAYDTLKSDSTREVYDFRIRKELADLRARADANLTAEQAEEHSESDQANENFDRGFNLLMNGDYEGAVQYMARAVFFENDNARYHAYHGKALSADNAQRHKAEGELQTAVRLDPNNTDYRIMLAEFFIQQNLFKRAEGELNRLLSIFPDHWEAKRILDSLPKK